MLTAAQRATFEPAPRLRKASLEACLALRPTGALDLLGTQGLDSLADWLPRVPLATQEECKELMDELG